MKLEDQNILFLTRTMKLGGTENVVLQLCEIFKPLVNKVIVCSCGGVNENKLKEMGIKHYIIPDISEKNPHSIVKTIITIKKIVDKENITIVHSHHRMAALYAELICDKSIVKIANAHNTFHDKKTLTRLAYRNTKLIAVGEMVKKNLVEYYEIPSEQVTVIHNAIKPFEDKITIDSTIEKLHQDGYFVVGNVGRLSEQKGMEYFIDAIPAVLKQHSKTKFLIIGKGELEEELKKRVADLKVEDAVIFMGYRSDIQNLMSQLDLEVLSSLWEGFPLIPIEAFSVGRTVVATGVDGTLEIVQNEENGLMIEPRKPDQIAEAISRFIEDKNLKDKCEYGAKKSYEKEYSFDKFAEANRDYYRRLLEKS
jgi:glycosyltransferase involved in cell wall biosynthesis